MTCTFIRQQPFHINHPCLKSDSGVALLHRSLYGLISIYNNAKYEFMNRGHGIILKFWTKIYHHAKYELNPLKGEVNGSSYKL